MTLFTINMLLDKELNLVLADGIWKISGLKTDHEINIA